MRAVLDRFEGDYAVLLVEGEEVKVDWPRNYLPNGAKEGDILEINLRIDKQSTERQMEKISSLLDKLKSKHK